eukprot:gene5496-7464_t
MLIKRIGCNGFNTLRYRSIHRSSICRALIVEMVPALGESITEGSIAKWIKSVGEKVNVDDVVAIVETDKVTVDIKSVRSGVLTKQLATDTVIVGHPLYEIDSNDNISASISTSTVSQSLPPASTAIIDSSTELKSPHVGRKPSIHFLGKRSKIAKDIKREDTVPILTTPTTSSSKAAHQLNSFVQVQPPVGKGGVDFRTLKGKGFYGRPIISDLEREAIESGGATRIF